MPRVTHVKKARKDDKHGRYKKGDSYYWWKFRDGGKQVSLTRPMPWQLTRSAYKQEVLMLQHSAGELQGHVATEDDLQEVISQVEEIQSQCQESFDNIPESLQYAPSGELLQERIDACDNAMMEMETFKDEFSSAMDSRDACDTSEPGEEPNEDEIEVR